MRIPLTAHGTREMTVLGLVLVAAGYGLALVWWPLVILPALVLVWLFAFFRDPERTIPQDPRVLVSPADGTVTDVGEHQDVPMVDEPCLRIGIFLSVFNVHVNRSPMPCTVRGLNYRPGKFLDARHPDATTQNEAQDIHLEGPFPVLVRQISGLIARRIVCPLKEGQALDKGQRFGMIKFGSRTELYIPTRCAPEALVKVGDKVQGGATPLARVAEEFSS